MYNPFSVLNVFDRMDFAEYWFKTGTPTFLVNALRSDEYDIRKLNKDVMIAARSIDEYRAGETSLIPLLYQSGYLTIKSFDASLDAFTLGFPNEEVKLGNKQIEQAAENLLKLKEKIDADKMREPSFLMVLTGGQYVYRRKDGVCVVQIGCLKN